MKGMPCTPVRPHPPAHWSRRRGAPTSQSRVGVAPLAIRTVAIEEKLEDFQVPVQRFAHVAFAEESSPKGGAS